MNKKKLKVSDKNTKENIQEQIGQRNRIKIEKRIQKEQIEKINRPNKKRIIENVEIFAKVLQNKLFSRHFPSW